MANRSAVEHHEVQGAVLGEVEGKLVFGMDSDGDGVAKRWITVDWYSACSGGGVRVPGWHFPAKKYALLNGT
jgi:hypothetical protein